MPRPRVFVTRRLPELGLRMIEESCAMEVWPDRLPPSAEVLREKVRACDGLVSLLTDRIDGTVLDAAPRLKVVSNFAVGFNNIDVATATARGVLIGNTPGVLTEATADIAVALLLAAARRLGEAIADAKEGRWLTWEPTGWLACDLVGRTLGIVGMGRIGFATAKRLHFGWDMKILYAGPRPHPEADAAFGARRVDLETLLRESDFVSVHAALNEQTKGMFGAEQFRLMKKSAVFVNTARGGHVDQDALVDAIRSETIFAAGLDVTEPEPLPSSHPLYSLPRVVIAPHIASATADTRDAMARICAENLLAALAGRPMTSCVNPELEQRLLKATVT